MTTVLFLGAGASVDAGYPCTAKLLKSIDAYCKETFKQQVRQEWEFFTRFINQANNPLLQAVSDPGNPELVFTVLDLLKAALDDYDSETNRQLEPLLDKYDESKAAKVNSRWYKPMRKQLEDAEPAKNAFQRVAHTFFAFKHYDDNDADNNAREYLCQAFGPLKAGDTIITTNWDTLAERVLMEQNKWFPDDGYGFPVLFESTYHRRLGEERTRKSSEVKVLKLHGSTGWNKKEFSDEVYLSSAYLLRHFPHHHDLKDINEPSGSPEPLLSLPSYLKQIEGAIMQSIWSQAAEALNNADEVQFIGYSLPEADMGVRALINPVRERLKKKEVEVKCINPDKNDGERFKMFLGDNIILIPKTAKDAFSPPEQVIPR